MKRKKIQMNRNSAEIDLINNETVDAYSPYFQKHFLDKYACFGVATNNGGVGLSMVYGPLGHGYWESMFCDYQTIQSNLEDLKNDDEVKSIILLINSPGGAVSGLFTLCDYIKQIDKPITAFITGEACSAAYAIATSCDKVYMERDAVTGCCGCYAEAVMEKQPNFISKIFRSANAPKKNLSVFDNKEAEKEYQARIDKIGEEYLNYIADNRGVEYDTALTAFGQGLVVDSGYALENNMVDGVGTFAEVFAEVLPKEDETTEEETIITTNSSHSATRAESEGEIYMTKDDIVKMTSEQRAELFNALCEVDNSLLSPMLESEKQRIVALNGLRDGSANIDSIVDKAIAEGKKDSEVALEVLKATKENAQNDKTQKVEALNALAGATQATPTPEQFDEESFMDEVMKQVKEIR